MAGVRGSVGPARVDLAPILQSRIGGRISLTAAPAAPTLGLSVEGTIPVKLLSYCDWDGRPAALFKHPAGGFLAFAQLSPGAPWVSVDADDVSHTSGVLSREPSEAVLRDRFGWSIGAAEVPSEANVMSFVGAVEPE